MKNFHNKTYSLKNNKRLRGVAKMWFVISLFLLLILSVYTFWRWNTQPNIITIDAPLAKNFPSTGFPHKSLEQLLTRFVNEQGRVDYNRWHKDKNALQQLDQYLASVAKFSPKNTPKRFLHKNEKLTYWVYAYNALVIKSILINWPLSSVTDLVAPVEIVKGLGFFYKQKFIFGGQAYNLYTIEHDKIFNGKNDPRIHFILNCGSEGCPALRPQLPTGENLDDFLAQAARDFVDNPKNLLVDHNKKVIYLSSIFKWNRDDFIAVIHHSKKDSTLVDYLLTIGSEKVVKQLEQAKDYPLRFIEYDWLLNQSKETKLKRLN